MNKMIYLLMTQTARFSRGRLRERNELSLETEPI
jgi:hypothetical protein